MNPKENFLAVLRHQTPQWIPWVPLIDPANTPIFVPTNLRDNWEALSISLYLYEELGCDLLLGDWLVLNKFKTAKFMSTSNGNETTKTFIINGKKLSSKSKVAINGLQKSHAITEYMVKTYDDLLAYEELLEDQIQELNPEEFIRLSKGIGDKGIVTPMGPTSPIMDMVLNIAGGENFVYLLMDYPEEMERILDKIHIINLRYYELLLNSGLDFEVVRSHEDFDTLLISHNMFKKYVFPCLKDYVTLCHDAGKLFMMHSCGHVKDLVSLIPDTGIDAHHYLTSPPVGNIECEDVIHLWKGKVTVMAAVDPLLQAVGTEEDVRNDVVKLLKAGKPGDSLIVMSALKPDIPEANIRIVQKTMAEYGRYPVIIEQEGI